MGFHAAMATAATCTAVLWFHSYWAHTIFLTAVLLAAAYNGATYYFHIFANRSGVWSKLLACIPSRKAEAKSSLSNHSCELAASALCLPQHVMQACVRKPAKQQAVTSASWVPHLAVVTSGHAALLSGACWLQVCQINGSGPERQQDGVTTGAEAGGHSLALRH